ncbi:phosphotransferase enzyme family protein [Streptomyces sp. NPDC002851]
MTHEEWARDLAGDVLAVQYGIDAVSVDPAAQSTDRFTWRARTTDGRRLVITQYRHPTAETTRRERAAWDMSEFCRAAELPVPRVVPDRTGYLITATDEVEWAVTEEAPGRVATGPMTPERAEHLGLVLGRMHRALAAYPLPPWKAPTQWLTGTVEESIAHCTRALNHAVRQQHPLLPRLRDDLEQRREDLRRHTLRLRSKLPERQIEQAVHADYRSTNVLVLTDIVTAVTGFRAATAAPAWELGRAAFDPCTVASSTRWVQCALRMIEAYRSENPGLPLAEVQAIPRITLLHLLHNVDGATSTPGHHQPGTGRLRQWADTQAAVRRLLTHLDDLEQALRTIGSGR